HGARADEAFAVSLCPWRSGIPRVASRLARPRRYDAIICLGAVIRGEPPHCEYSSAEVSRGIARVSYDYGLPVIFGVLTTDTEEQANARSGAREGARPTGKAPVPAGEGWEGAKTPGAGGCNRGVNRGYDAGVSAIEMANLMKRLPGLSKHRPSRKRSR